MQAQVQDALAIDAQKDVTLYCERWNVSDMGANSVEARFMAFAEYGAFWMSDGADALIAEADSKSKSADSTPVSSDESEFIVRG